MRWLSSGGLAEARFFIGLAGGRFSLYARTYLWVGFKYLSSVGIELFFNSYLA